MGSNIHAALSSKSVKLSKGVDAYMNVVIQKSKYETLLEDMVDANGTPAGVLDKPFVVKLSQRNSFPLLHRDVLRLEPGTFNTIYVSI